MIKKSLAIGLLALAGAAQAAVVSKSGSFNSYGYDVVSLDVAANDTYDFTDTGASFDSLIAVFDEFDEHIISGDDTVVGGVGSLYFHLTQFLKVGSYTALITSSRAVEYLKSERAKYESTDGFNTGDYYSGGFATLDGMKAFLEAPSGEALAFQAYSLDISTPMPEPATYGLVALALAGLALTRRRRA